MDAPIHAIESNFFHYLKQQTFPNHKSKTTHKQIGLHPRDVIDGFETQIMSRQLDLMARKLRKANHTFYTIGSSGHEGMAGFAQVFRTTDIAFLHYRDAAFYIQRAKKAGASAPLYDLLLSFCAASDDPISSGRHKVLGSKFLTIPPQTSTIASHIPKSVGAALGIPRAVYLDIEHPLPDDALAICSFGDASLNHSTCQGALNLANWLSYQHIPLPLVMICEDNNVGISVPTPKDWVEQSVKSRPAIHYLQCDGLNLMDVIKTARQAEAIARTKLQPVFVHMKTVRLMGHAGSDAESTYLSKAQIEAIEFEDPLLHTARYCINNKLLTAHDIENLYQTLWDRLCHIARETITHPKLQSASEVMASVVPQTIANKAALPSSEHCGTPEADRTRQADRNNLNPHLTALEKKQIAKPQHMAKLINWTLSDIMAAEPNTVIFGEDVAKKGGVYHVTTGLQEKFGRRRVFNSLLDEQSILGTAIGLAHNGILPIPEIQFLAYLHNAEDQIRGEAATLSFFSNGQYTNPMVVRIAGLAYQKGFGGHFHNDNSLAVLRDIPGLIIACPSNGHDAALMLRRCIYEAKTHGRVAIFIEPIALYMTKHLHEENDGLWQFDYPKPEQMAELGQALSYGEHADNLIITYGNGHYLSQQAAKILAVQHNIQVKILDLQWIAPLDVASIVEHAASANNVLIVEECRKTGSLAEAIVTHIVENIRNLPHIKVIAAEDSFIPLGDAANLVLPSKEQIVTALIKMVKST